jgi:hypothetical protein
MPLPNPARIFLHSFVLAPVAILLFSAGLIAQATFSAAPPLLHQVKTIYVGPSPGTFVVLLEDRLAKWNVVRISSVPDEADAILTCQTQSTFLPSKVVLRLTTADITLIDRQSRKLIWRTSKSTSFDIAKLADDVIDQLKKDWRKSGSEF